MIENFRTETDSMGSVEVPNKALWGAQTQRALKNFPIGNEKMPIEIIYALATIKKVAAITNNELDVLEEEKKNLIVNAASEIEAGIYDSQFPLNIWQTGSGTQTNMNVNEVIGNIASQKLGLPLGKYHHLHPNDDVNRSQSTNDVFPAAIQIAVIKSISHTLIPELNNLLKILEKRSIEWNHIIKVGRTHLQDAVPLSLGQEVSAWENQIRTAAKRIESSLVELYQLPLGGTAVGTGINAPKRFDNLVAQKISALTHQPFKSSTNKFAIMASHDGLVNSMSQLKNLAVTLFKIINDIRLLSCGPRAGFAELSLPENEPGSSIMPGKVNPTQCEAMAMVCTQIMGMDTTVSIAGSGGHLQMNAYKPLIGFNILKSIELLHDACYACRTGMIEGIKPNLEKIEKDLHQSLMLVTAMAPHIGYKKSAEIAQLAHKENTSLKKAALKLKYVDEKDLASMLNLQSMVHPHD